MTSKKLFHRTVRLTALVLPLMCAALVATPALAKKADLPEVSKDGLHLVKHTKVAAAYVLPGASFAGYTKVKILDCFVDFRKNWARDYNMDELGLEGRITDKDQEAIKKRLADDFNKEFTKVLTHKGYEIVDDVGQDVLLLRPALINVDVTAPDLPTSDMRRTWIKSAGEMTLYMEFYDSATSTLLARVVDPQADDTSFAQPANRATNTAAADRILNHWAELLVKHLEEVKTGGGAQ